MATSRSQTAKHSKRDVDIALKRRPEPETVSPPEMTIPATATRRFDIYTVQWSVRKEMAEELTTWINGLAKRTRSVVVVVGQSADDSGITYTVEYWTY